MSSGHYTDALIKGGLQSVNTVPSHGHLVDLGMLKNLNMGGMGLPDIQHNKNGSAKNGFFSLPNKHLFTYI